MTPATALRNLADDLEHTWGDSDIPASLVVRAIHDRADKIEGES